MKTKKKLLTLTVSALMCTHTHANPLTVCDFEDYPLGTEWTMWNTISSTAKVEADPLNAKNKVLHVVLRDWGCHPEFTLSTELTGKALTDRYLKNWSLYISIPDRPLPYLALSVV